MNKNQKNSPLKQRVALALSLGLMPMSLMVAPIITYAEDTAYETSSLNECKGKFATDQAISSDYTTAGSLKITTDTSVTVTLIDGENEEKHPDLKEGNILYLLFDAEHS